MNVVITGIGVISAAGSNITDTLETFRNGRRNAGKVSLFSSVLSYPVFEVKTINKKWHREGMRTTELALCAVEEALNDADLREGCPGHRVGVCLGTTVASQLNDIDFYRAYRDTGVAAMHSVDRFLKGNLAEVVARNFRLEGPCLTVVNACSSGADAIGVGLSWLRNNLCDIVIAGGADELSRIPLCGFGTLGIVSDSLCAPFDRDRTGLNLGEGAGIVILEREETAYRRGLKPLLSLTGYGSASDAYHLTAPCPNGKGLEMALQNALMEANVDASDVCFVNAHATATRDNDKVEGMVLARVFGPQKKVLATKGFTGHTLGAAGGIEAAFTAMSLREGWIPASIGFVHQDDEIPIMPVKDKTPIHGRVAVSTSLAFGGNNTALVIACTGNYAS